MLSIGVKGGENTVKFNNRIIFALMISLLLLFSAGYVFAGDNESVTDLISTSSQTIDTSEINENSQVLAIDNDDEVVSRWGF